VSESFVLDSSAVLCLIQNEPGASLVREALPLSCLSAVNLAEITSKLSEWGMDNRVIASALDPLQLRIIPFDATQARACGMLRQTTRRLGLSLGDRACLALAANLKATALTTDRAWSAVGDIATVKVVR